MNAKKFPDDAAVHIEIVEAADVSLAAALTGLMPQLLGRESLVTIDSLNVLLSQPGIKLFIVKLEDTVVGTAQLTVYERLYAPMAMVDGVVVDESARGRGIAGQLMQAIIDCGRDLGLQELNLTSSPQREAANHLYGKLGFEQYQTNYYRFRY